MVGGGAAPGALLPPGGAAAAPVGGEVPAAEDYFTPAQLARAEAWFRRWGTPSLLLAWLPVIGERMVRLVAPLQGDGVAGKLGDELWAIQDDVAPEEHPPAAVDDQLVHPLLRPLE